MAGIRKKTAIKPTYKRLMLAAGYRRIADLAIAANIGFRTVHNTVCFRRGAIKNIRVKNLIALAHVLKTTPGHLLDTTLEEEGYTDAAKVQALVSTFATETNKVATQISILNQCLDTLNERNVPDKTHREGIRDLIFKALSAVPTPSELYKKQADPAVLTQAAYTLKLITEWADSRRMVGGPRLVLHLQIATKNFENWTLLMERK